MIAVMVLRNNVQTLLDAYSCSDATERSYRDRMLQLASAPGDPFSRRHFNPGHFTASAFIMSPDARSVLLIHHTKLNRWLQPGGHIEPGDASLVAAAAREVLEETGVVPASIEPSPFDLDVHPIPVHGDEPNHEHFDLRFLCHASGFEVAVSDEVRDARWFALDDAITQSGDESVRRVVKKLRATYGVSSHGRVSS